MLSLLTSGTGSLDAGTDPNLLAGAVGVDVSETLMLATYVRIFLSTERVGWCEFNLFLQFPTRFFFNCIWYGDQSC